MRLQLFSAEATFFMRLQPFSAGATFFYVAPAFFGRGYIFLCGSSLFSAEATFFYVVPAFFRPGFLRSSGLFPVNPGFFERILPQKFSARR
jgi:hypothetical protein